MLKNQNLFMEINSSVAYLYCIVAVVCSVVLIFAAATVFQTTKRHSNSKFVVLAYIFAGLSALFDCAYILREAGVTHFSESTNYILTVLYVVFSSLTGTFWVVYSELKQNSWFAKTKLRFNLYCVPLAIFLLVCVTTPFTHIYFYFEGSEYKRGPLFIVLSLLVFIYVVQTGIVALIKSFKKENYVDRFEYRRLFEFAVVYMIVQTIQLALPDIFPYRSVGLMLVYCYFLVQSLKETIGSDALTHINNRFAAERHLATLLKGKEKFEVVMLDIDKFKGINDEYGHLEGDKALQHLSNVLSTLRKDDYFASRMGGDEFLLVNTNLDNSLTNVEKEINENICKILKENNSIYSFTVSAGVTCRDEKLNSIPDLIADADNKLYKRKDEKNKK